MKSGYTVLADEGSWRRQEEGEAEGRDDASALKKPALVWSVELHRQFVAAVNQLGIDKAAPAKILELMNVPGLTRENVARHLQKYRLYLRRLSGVSQHQNTLNDSFLSPQEASFGTISSINGTEGQQQHLSSSKPMNLLQEFPTNMEPAVSKRISDVLLRRNGVAGGNGAPAHNPGPRSSPLLSFPVNQTTVVNFPLGSIPGISSITTKGSFQEEVTSGNKGSFGTISSINGIDLRTLAVAGQLPAQSLATFQAAGFGDRQHKASDDADYSSLADEGNSMFCASLASICHALCGFKM